MAFTSRVQSNWERLVSSALLKAELRGSSNEVRPESTSGIVPTSLGSNIDSILQAADEVEGELPDGPHVSRILCEYAYSLAQRLDPKSAGRGVLQFKTGLKSIIKQKQSRKEGERLDRSLDIELLQRFYAFYRKKHNVEQLQNTTNMGLGETEKVRRVFATLRVLRDVLAELTRNMEGIPGQLKAVMDSDAAKVFKPYNILPLEVPGAADARMNFPEVRAAILELKYTAELPQLPESFAKPTQRPLDIFDLLHFVFGFQADNVNNQREHLLLLLSNRQARLGGLQDNNSPLDEKAINENYQRFLQNYERWCTYVRKQSVCSRFPPTRQMKLILVALYMLIWGEAANLRFLPECLCYIFHRMAENLFEILRTKVAERGKNWKECENPFLEHVVLPVYQVIAAEAENNDDGKAPHAVWRNYDDFNEYFWSSTCFQLDWPWRLDADFFERPRRKKKAVTAADSESPIRYRKGQFGGKVFFVEHRTFVHGYHSFHRLWMFLLMMLQGMTIVAFTKNLHLPSIKKILSLGPTYVIMKFFQSFLDVMLMYGAYATTNKAAVTRICFRFVWFGACSGLLTYLYIKVLEEPSAGISDSTYFQIYILVLVIYAVYRIFLSVLLRLPAFYRLTDKCGNGGLIRFIKWIQQERFFVGRGLYESSFDYLSYVLFWVLVLGAKFTFSYFMQIKPLVSPTKLIINFHNIKYAWHDIVSQGNHNALTVAFIWAPVMLIYFLDLQIWYTIVSALYGGLNGARSRLGEIRSLGMIRKRFETFPEAFVHKMVPFKAHGQVGGRSKIKDTTNEQLQAIQFAPFWNELIHNLRAEDYISNKECELLLMPSNLGKINLVQWPLFLLANKVYLAIDIAKEANLNQTDLWDRMGREEYMRPAIVEIYYSVQDMLIRLVQSSRAPREWVNHVFNYIRDSIHSSSFVAQFQMDHLSDVLVKVTKLAELLYHEESPDRIKSVVKALEDLYETVMHDFLSLELRENIEAWEFLDKAKQEGKLFDERINWPSPEERLGIKRLYSLLSIKDSALSIPRNLEARRRLNFFTNSLFMKMPEAPPVQKMLSFSVFTPYYSEDVLYTKDQLRSENEDGITILFYLQKIFPDEWKNFLERIGLTETALMLQLKDDKMDLIELRLWASYRGQTLARTVRGMMYYHKALMLQSFLEKIGMSDVENGLSYEDFREYKTDIDASAQAALKFTYVVSCQIYGQQKQKKETKAMDINYLLQKNEALRVAYIDVVEKVDTNGKVHKEFYSKLIKADTTGKDQEIYSVKLPGNPKIGEGKPENQNHAVIFTRGDAIQTIDMNQDNYFEEAFKMRNLLEEFDIKHGIRKPTILGVREHVFTGSVSSLAWFMSNQESSFVTLGQRVLANPLKVRMHYGHPDVFDRVFHITRGGISKASRVINISEDIFAGFNSTLRQGNITHHEYIQVGKGRDVGLNQIALFEAKVSSGNGEQMLSRDVYRLGNLFDFFRMLSFFYTSVGYYICTLMTVWTVYAFLYGRAYLCLSGVEKDIKNRAEILDNAALQSVLNAQFLYQIGIFTAIPMIVCFLLELGVLRAIISFITMQLQLCSVFFTFSLGTRSHYFGRTILHGGAKYRATGRGFVVQHIKFAENYRLYSRSHFVKALEVVMLLIVYVAYGSSKNSLSYILLTFSSWFLALSWLYAPYLFNPSGFEWQKTVDDFDNWTGWLLYKGGVGVKEDESWEKWWDEEQAHLRSLRSRVLETILSLRFFIFQYGVVYHLSAAGGSTSITVYGISWLVFVGLILVMKIFTTSQKSATNLQLFLRLFQGLAFMLILGGVIAAVAATRLTTADLFASGLALIPTGWAILSIAIAWKPIVKFIGLWQPIRSLARLYDAGMGLIIFVPIAILSWFPFVSTFQTRLVFNQAFSRGLEISLILAGNRPNAST